MPAPFRVGIRPSSDLCRVRGDGVGNTQCLLGELGQSFILRTFEPLAEPVGSICTFMIPLNPPLLMMAIRRRFNEMREGDLIVKLP